MSLNAQIFDASFRDVDSNFIYNSLVNNKIVKPPFMNYGPRQVFTQTKTEEGDKKNFYVQKRDGFTKLNLYSQNIETGEYEKDYGDRFFTDVKELNNQLYFYSVTRDRTRSRVWKTCEAINEFTDFDACNISVYNISRYEIVNEAGVTVGVDYSYPFSPGLYEKFSNQFNFTKKKVCGEGKIHYVLENGTTVISITDMDGNVINANTGDYIMVTNESSPFQGMVFEGAGYQTGVDGLLLSTDAPILSTSNQMYIVNYCVFEDYSESISWVTSDGIANRAGDECSSSTMQTYYSPSTYSNSYNNANPPKRIISSIGEYKNALYYYDKKRGYIIPSVQPGLQRNSYSALQAIQVGNFYTHVEEFQDYLLLMGPNKIGYVTMQYNPQLGVYQSQFTPLSNHNGYHNAGSRVNVDQNFYIVRDSKDFYGLGLQAYGTGVKPIFNLLSKFINTDLDLLNRSAGDYVTIDVRGDDIDLFCTNQNGVGTIMIKYNAFYQARHTWIVGGNIEINKSYKGIYLGNGLYCNTGDTDNGEEIKQYITMSFGDQTQCQGKFISGVKLPIGYNSIIDEDTWFVITGNSGGKSDIEVRNNLATTEYVSLINQAREANRYELIRKYPIGVCVETDVGIGNDKVHHTLQRRIHEFQNYKPKQTDNYIDGDNQLRIAKYGILKYDIEQITDISYFEIIARGKNSVEFGGFCLMYEYLNNEHTSYENVLTDSEIEPFSGLFFNPIITDD